MNLFGVAMWVHEVSRYGGTTAMQLWAESRNIPLAILRYTLPVRTVLSASKIETAVGYVVKRGEGPDHSWQVRTMLIALGRQGAINGS